VTILTGSLLDGGRMSGILQRRPGVYPEYIRGECVDRGRYRGQGHAVARVINSASIALMRAGGDDGCAERAGDWASAPPRLRRIAERRRWHCWMTQGTVWSGEYQAWSSFCRVGSGYFSGEAGGNVPSPDGFLYGDVREWTGYVDIAGRTAAIIRCVWDAGVNRWILLLLRR